MGLSFLEISVRMSAENANKRGKTAFVRYATQISSLSATDASQIVSPRQTVTSMILMEPVSFVRKGSYLHQESASFLLCNISRQKTPTALLKRKALDAKFVPSTIISIMVYNAFLNSINALLITP